MKFKYFPVLMVLVLALAAAVACDIGDDNNPTPESNSPPNNDGGQQPETTAADLQILDLGVERANDATGTFTHKLVATVRNNGGTDASGFNVNCSWSCAGGSVTSFSQDLIYDGFVQANGQFTYRQSFRDPCETSFGSVPMTCIVDSSNAVSESNENNNRWEGTGNFN